MCNSAPRAIVLSFLLVALTGFGAEAQTSGLLARPSNTTCIAPSSPPTNARVSVGAQVMLNGADFETAVTAVASGSNPKLWYVAIQGVAEMGFVESVVDNSPGDPTRTIFLDISDRVLQGFDGGLLGIALHPNWTVNGEAFVVYTGPSQNDPYITYVSRFRSLDGGLTLDPSSEEILIALPQPGPIHHGGHLEFGPDGYLYLGFGDGGGAGSASAQDTSNLLGSIARIDVDSGSPYGIPVGNPFAGGGGAPEIWAWGFRNPWSWSFDAPTGDLWVGDVGKDTWEEIDIAIAGGNFGWPIYEASECNVGPCPDPSLIAPVAEHLHSQLGGDAKTIIGGRVYRGSAIPGLQGAYVYADYSGVVWGLFEDLPGVFTSEYLFSDSQRIIGFAEDHDGEIVLLGDQLRRIVPVTPPPPGDFPELLSETGCVDPNDPLVPAAGVIPFDVNSPLWSDGAAKERWLAIPDGTTIDITSDGDFYFPVGTVLMKNFHFQGELVETRLFVRHPGGNWGGYSYEWDDLLTDATLLEMGITKDVNGLPWTYPTRQQCFTCHTSQARFSLGPKVGQLNGDITYPSTSITANQLETLDAIGMFSSPLAEPVSELSEMAAVDDMAETLSNRARSYLDVNCANCHQDGGSAPATIDFRYETAVPDMNICNADPLQGDLGVPGAKLVTPLSSLTSIVSLRMHDLLDERMPPLGTVLKDIDGTTAIDQWINADTDVDEHADACDNCPEVWNSSQLNSDTDRFGNECDEDDDNDGLLDVVETNTGTYNSPADTGTDPTNADTDGDTFSDGDEVVAGSDPHSPLSTPSTLLVPLLAPWGLWLLGAMLAGVAIHTVRQRA